MKCDVDDIRCFVVVGVIVRAVYVDLFPVGIFHVDYL